jgi:hypothetical protein
MINKFTIILLFIINFATINAQIEIRLTKSENSEIWEQIKEDKIKLSITTDQENEFERITKKYLLKIKEIKNKFKNKKRECGPLQRNRHEKNEEMKRLLLDEQFKIYISWQEPRMYWRKDGKLVRFK